MRLGRQRRRTPVPRAEKLTLTVARRIRKFRLAAGLSQAELGAPYLTRAAISSLERQVTSPSLHVLAYIAKRLGVPVAALVRDR